MAGQVDFTIDQGTDFYVQFKLVNRDLTGYAARMQFRKDYDAQTPLITATTANGKLSISYAAPDSLLTLHLAPADTVAIRFKGDEMELVHDLELVAPNGGVERALQGIATLSREITR